MTPAERSAGPWRQARELAPAVIILCLAALATSVLASEVGGLDRRLVGHPRSRFPLVVFIPSAGEPRLQAALDEAVRAWNEVTRAVLGLDAFRPAADAAGADVDVVVALDAPLGDGGMGLTALSWDDQGEVIPPVRVALARARAMGQTPADRVLFQVAAHELGHALGLPHVNEPGSIMCCDHARLDLSDPAVRAAYVAARRRPDVGSAADQIAEHYHRFWGR